MSYVRGMPTPPQQAKPSPVPTGQGPAVAGGPVTAEPNAVYEGFVHQRQELRDQLSRVRDQRQDVSNQLQGDVSGADRRGLEQQITQLDQRTANLQVQLAQADAQVAAAAAVPGAVVETPPYVPSGPPEEVWILTGIFFVVVLFPLSLALARRLWKRSVNAVTSLPQEIYDRFSRVEQSLDAIAIEVERLGEGQRFVARVLSERGPQLGAGAAEPVPVPGREPKRERR